MLQAINGYLENQSGAAATIISIALMLFGGFAMSRFTKLFKFPNVTGYILAGVLLGPYCLDLLPSSVIAASDFISDIALALIAFGVGQFFRLSTLRKNGVKTLLLTLIEAFVTSISVFSACFWILDVGFAFSLILAAIASVVGPTSTMMTIRQTGAKGEFVDTLLETIAFDDVISLFAYSIAVSAAVATVSGNGEVGLNAVWLPIVKNFVAIAFGAVFGLLLKLLLPGKRSTDNRLIVAVGLLIGFCGICSLLDVSPLLGCMMIGTVYVNIADDNKLFLQVGYFAPPILLIFYVRSGAEFRFDTLFSGLSIGNVPLWTVVPVYFVVRTLGKLFGAALGSSAVGKDKNVRKFLGMALLPQGGVAIGLAALGARTIGGDIGNAVETVILAACVIYEFVGPVLAKLSLSLAGAYSKKLEVIAPIDSTDENGKPLNEVELLIKRIAQIRSENPYKNSFQSDEEQAFTEAAEEQLEAMGGRHRGLMGKR